MEKISHHYVPQFYLKNFSNNHKSIGLYINKKDVFIKEASIKKQACKDYLYGKTLELEDFLMETETNVSKIIKEIINTHTLPSKNSQEYQLLIFFMLLSESRNLKTAESANNYIDSLLKAIINNDDGFSNMRKNLDLVKFVSTIPNLIPIKNSQKSYPLLLDLKPVLIVNAADRDFITSDNPLVKYNQLYIKKNYYRGYGIMSVGLQLFFTISPRLCICVFDDTTYECKNMRNESITITKGKEIDELNKLFYLNSYQKIFMSNKITKSYIKRIIDGLPNTMIELDKEVKTKDVLSGQLISYIEKRVQEPIKLQFFKIIKEKMVMDMPNRLAAPVRPGSQVIMNRLNL